MRAPLRKLYVVLALLQLVPIWSVHYLPLVDGPSHLYNSSVLMRLATGHGGRLNDFYQIDWRPNPNWLSHSVIAVMMLVFPPILIEKLVVSGIILFFLAAAWRFARGEPAAFLALPLAYHQSVQFGFYNFSFAVGLYLFIVAIWWKRRDEPTVGTIALIGGLLVLCDIAHPMPTGLAIVTIGILWLMTVRDHRFLSYAKHLLAFVPVTAMLIWYLGTQSAPTMRTHQTWAYLIQFLAEGKFLITYDARQWYLGAALFVVYVILAIATLWLDRRQANAAFAAVVGVLLLLYFASPSEMAGGLGVNDRLALFVFLVPLAWFTPNLPSFARTLLIAFVSIVAIGNVIFHTMRYHAADRVLTEIVRGFDGTEPESTFVPLIFDPRPPHSDRALMTHTVDYAATNRKLIDLVNYEAEVGYFPVRYRPNVDPIGTVFIALHTDQYDVVANAARADYIYTWKMPLYTPIAQRIEERYVLVREWGRGRLYRRR